MATVGAAEVVSSYLRCLAYEVEASVLVAGFGTDDLGPTVVHPVDDALVSAAVLRHTGSDVDAVFGAWIGAAGASFAVDLVVLALGRAGGDGDELGAAMVDTVQQIPSGTASPTERPYVVRLTGLVASRMHRVSAALRLVDVDGLPVPRATPLQFGCHVLEVLYRGA